MMNTKGMSIVELMISSIIITMILGVVTSIFVSARCYLDSISVSSELQLNYRIALQNIRRELQEAHKDYISINTSYPVIGTDAIIYRGIHDLDLDGIPDEDALGHPDWEHGYDKTIALDVAKKKLYVKSEAVIDKYFAANVKKVEFMNKSMDATLEPDEIKVLIELEDEDGRGVIHNIRQSSVISVRNNYN